MKQNMMLTIASLLSILLLTLHITDDIVRGISKAEPSNIALAVLVVLLYGTARRTEIGVRHHAARRVVPGSHARHAHEGGTLRRDRQVHRRLLLRLDTLGARHSLLDEVRCAFVYSEMANAAPCRRSRICEPCRASPAGRRV
jgi:hypothetical protein